MLAPRDGGIYVDATFGAGGYSRAILDAADTRVIGIDRDRTAIAGGFDLVEQSDGRLTLVEDRFSNLAEVCAAQGIDAGRRRGDGCRRVVDADRPGRPRLLVPPRRPARHAHGPATVRPRPMSWRRASEADLAKIIYIFGEERHSRAVARAIVAARKEAPIATTRQLADIVSKVVWAKPGEIHPATRTFQALRIFVNEELDELHLALAAAERVLKPGGRLAVVSFHSLEDRIVKNFMVERSKPGGGSRHLPELAQSAPSFTIADQASGHCRRRRGQRQSARAFGKTARRGAHRCAGARGRRLAGLADRSPRDAGRLTMRIIHLLVIAVLVFAAAYVYRIKMESTVRTERVLRLHADIREQRDAIAALRAEWAKLDAPTAAAGPCRASSDAEADRPRSSSTR